MNTREDAPQHLPAFYLSGFGIESQMVTCWEMFHYMLTAFMPKSNWNVFICIQSVNGDLGSMLFCSRGLVQETEGIFPFTCFNAHIQFKHKKWKFKKKKRKKKSFFHLVEVETLAYWKRENAIQAFGNIFQVYVGVAVPAAASFSVDKTLMSRCHSLLQLSTPKES